MTVWTVGRAHEYLAEVESQPPGKWVDKGTFWAWKGSPNGFCESPTTKEIIRDEDGVAIGVIDHPRAD